MKRRISLPVGATAGGLLATAFLPVAAAFADTGAGALGDAAATAPLGTAGSTASLGDVAGTTPLGDTGDLDSLSGLLGPLGNGGILGALGNAGGTTAPTGLPGVTPPGLTPGGETPPGVTPPGETSGASDSFTIGHDTFSPVQADGSEGFTPVSPLFSAPPFFEVGQGHQVFDVTSATGGAGNSGTGAGDVTGDNAGNGGTDLGSVSTNEDVSNFFGIHNAEFTVTGVDPASGASVSALPPVGSVYDVANLGNGFENVYSDIPGVGGAANTITDHLVGPDGQVINIPTSFDAAGTLNPGDVFSGVDVSDLGSDASGAAGGAADAATGAADAAGGAADAAGGAGDAASSAIDPLSLLGL